MVVRLRCLTQTMRLGFESRCRWVGPTLGPCIKKEIELKNEKDDDQQEDGNS